MSLVRWMITSPKSVQAGILGAKLAGCRAEDDNIPREHWTGTDTKDIIGRLDLDGGNHLWKSTI